MPEPCTSFTFHSNRILKLGRKSCLCMHKFLHITFQFTLNHVVRKSKTAVTRQMEQYSNNWCIFIMRQKAATRQQIFLLVFCQLRDAVWTVLSKVPGHSSFWRWDHRSQQPPCICSPAWRGHGPHSASMRHARCKTPQTCGRSSPPVHTQYSLV